TWVETTGTNTVVPARSRLVHQRTPQSIRWHPTLTCMGRVDRALLTAAARGGALKEREKD
ncbi:MAG TPA: hypothetical protein VF524_09925, partial [Polyangia bacterium]